jgi:hypothetical protein
LPSRAKRLLRIAPCDDPIQRQKPSHECAVRYKLVSIGLCSNLNGQIMTDLMVSPPKPGDASYPLYHQEVSSIFSSLKRRASKVCDASRSPATALGSFAPP